MRFLRVALVSTLFFSCAAHAQSLAAKINPILNNPQLDKASLGIEIIEITPRGPTTLFSRNPNTPLGPASNCKLLTTAAAFEKYGPNATFKTYLYQVGPDLALVGGGDPGFGDAKIAAKNGQTPTSAFDQWVARLKVAGITQFRDLIVDDRVFDQTWTHPNWPADQTLDWYAAPVGGLNFNANCLDWTPKLTTKGVALELTPPTSYISITNKAAKGSSTKISLIRPPTSNKFELRGTLAASASSPYSVPIYDPGLWTGTILVDTLKNAGIQSTGATRRALPDERLGTGILLASHQTPILDVLQRANTNSLNMMAEALCKRLGYDATKNPGTWENGAAAIEAYARSLGLAPDLVSIDDGSGLSNKNRVAPHVFTTVLAHVAAGPDGAKFIDTLALPGDEGTLQKRFKGLSVADHVKAKTGHISGVSALSGYVLTDSRRFAFSILINKYQGNVNPLQDQICQTLYDWAK